MTIDFKEWGERKDVRTYVIPNTRNRYHVLRGEELREETGCEYAIYSTRNRSLLKDSTAFRNYKKGLSGTYGITRLQNNGKYRQQRMTLKDILELCDIK